MEDVRTALRRELESRGYVVQSDTAEVNGKLYIMGENDLATALFEFEPTASEAIESMYQGRWTEGLPPRFAVLPAEAAADPSFELLEQMRIIPLLYVTAEDCVTLLDLDAALDRIGGRR